jgi:hypothetical protein
VAVRNFNRSRNSLEIAPERGVAVANHRYGAPARYTFRYVGDARQNRTVARDSAGRRGGTFGAFAFAFARAATARSRARQRQRSRRSVGHARRSGGAIFQRPRGRSVAGDVYGRLANDHGLTILRTSIWRRVLTKLIFAVFDV